MIRQFYCAEPLQYIGQEAVKRDVENLQAALAATQAQPSEAFMASVTPGVIEHWLKNEHYRDDETYLVAIADVMREEYLAIVEGGFTLQIDDPDVADGWQMYPEMTVGQYRDYAELRVAALNHALRGIPRDKVRIHVCWGSFQIGRAHV